MHISEEASCKKSCYSYYLAVYSYYLAAQMPLKNVNLSCQLRFISCFQGQVRNMARLIFDLDIQHIVCIKKIFS